jgi:glycosyltransferase involved in cell wall biosynthesis
MFMLRMCLTPQSATKRIEAAHATVKPFQKKNGMISVGIINPSWTISRNNTDHRCVTDLIGMKRHTQNLEFHFAGSRADYLAANTNWLTARLLKKQFIRSIPIVPARRADAYYRYGHEIHGLDLSSKVDKPVISTLGFPTLLADQKRGPAYLQRAADALESVVCRSAIAHFHTDCMREAFLAHAPQWESRCVTAPFYMPYLEIVSEDAIQKKFESGSTKILFVGRDGPRKGIDQLCKALDLISKYLDERGVEVTIVSATKTSCTEYKNIRFFPSLSRTEVQGLMRQSHIYAMVPNQESFGLVFVEAMAAGCALLSDNDIPRREIQDQGKCGLLVEPGRAGEIADALKSLIENRQSSLKMALHGRERAATRYEPTLVAQQYAAAFARATK